MDIATAAQQRIDFSRVCIEISAKTNLPKVVQITMGQNSVNVPVEYQWIPPSCSLCNVFGHTCKPKADPLATNKNEAWKVIGKALGGGGDALEAVTKIVSNIQTDTVLCEDVETNESEAEETDSSTARIGASQIIPTSTSSPKLKLPNSPVLSPRGKLVAEVNSEGKTEVGFTSLLEPDPGPLIIPTDQGTSTSSKIASREAVDFRSSSSKKKNKKQNKGKPAALSTKH